MASLGPELMPCSLGHGKKTSNNHHPVNHVVLIISAMIIVRAALVRRPYGQDPVGS